MYLRNLIPVLVMALVCVSCGKRTFTVSEVLFEEEKVYVDGKPFTGTVSSDDGTTWQMTTHDGVPTSVNFFHGNGVLAYAMATPADTLDMRVYDESGQQIPIDSFAEQYKDLAAQIPALLHLIKADANQ